MYVCRHEKMYCKGSGILPYAKHEGKLYFLLGQEDSWEPEWSERDLWCEFAGKIERGESPYICGIREGYEETMGIFGSIEELKMKLNPRDVIIINKCGYLPLKIEFDQNLPILFERFRNYSLEYLNKHSNHNKRRILMSGRYEKKAIAWFDTNEMDKTILRRHMKHNWVRLIKLIDNL